MILYRYSDKGRRKLFHSVSNIPITWRHIPEDWNFHCHYCDNLRSHKSLFFLPCDCAFILWHFRKEIIVMLHSESMGVF